MDDPILTIDEREAINAGRWFSSLSPSLRHDILRCAVVKRYKDGERIAARGEPPEQWIACAKGAVRVSSTAVSGKQITLTYVEPGIWFGDVAIFDGDRRTHDAYKISRAGGNAFGSDAAFQAWLKQGNFDHMDWNYNNSNSNWTW